jgi:lysophospholipase L1-like esterase
MNVCFVGDSLVLGYGAPACLGWPGRVCARAESEGHPFVCYNLGVRGAPSSVVKDFWVEEAARRLKPSEPARLIFSFGVADANQSLDLDATLTAAKSILTVAKAMCPAAFVGPAPVLKPETRERIEQVSRLLAGVCNDVGISFLDVFTPLSTSAAYEADLKAGDGVHPGARGYDEFARLVWSHEPTRNLLVS